MIAAVWALAALAILLGAASAAGALRGRTACLRHILAVRRALRERAAWRAVTRDEDLRCQLTRAWLEERAEQVRRLIREHLGEDGGDT